MNHPNETALIDSTGQPQILLMEDERVLAQGFQMALKEEGFVVDLAMTGQDALDTMCRKEYDLIVADLRMPDMDGMEVVKRAKDDSPETRVIVVTGYANIESALEAFQSGVCDYLSKPLTEAEFIEAVNKALQEKGGPPAEEHCHPETGQEKLLQKIDVVRALKSAEDKDGAFYEKTAYLRALPVRHDIAGNQGPPVAHKKAGPEFADMPDLFHQDKMISLGRLAASVVHEINNPLSGILNYIRLMINIMGRSTAPASAEKEKFLRYLTVVESEVGRCSSIVSNLLAFSRKPAAQHGEVNIPELLHKCIMLSQHKLELENLSVKTRMDSPIPDVWGNFNQIQQCIINLIFNAIDAMDKGGTLTLACRYDDRENMVEIRVEDDGCGIAEEVRRKIFEPFFTTKNEGKGLGLGLATVCRIIEQHKGNIDVASEPGKGTIFTIRLPAMKKE